MKFTLNWLKQHLDTDASIEVVAEKLTDIGLEIEGVTDRAAALADIRVAHIEEAGQHPDADRLKLCRVNTGEKIIQVVCGAPNARAGLKVPFARVGAVLGDDVKIKQAKLRGVESNGMLCGADELGLSDEHDGLMELPSHFIPGADFAELLSLPDDVVKLIENQKLSAGHAKILVGLDNASFVASKIIENKLSVRQAENFVKLFKNKRQKSSESCCHGATFRHRQYRGG